MADGCPRRRLRFLDVGAVAAAMGLTAFLRLASQMVVPQVGRTPKSL